MKREINLQESSRAEAFRMWMSSPMPISLAISPVILCCLQNIDTVLTTTAAFFSPSSPAMESFAATGLPSKMIVKWISLTVATRWRNYRQHGFCTKGIDNADKICWERSVLFLFYLSFVNLYTAAVGRMTNSKSVISTSAYDPK